MNPLFVRQNYTQNWRSGVTLIALAATISGSDEL